MPVRHRSTGWNEFSGAPDALVDFHGLPAFVSLAFFQMIAMVGWMMMAMATRAVRVFYAASNAPLTLEDDGGATLPLHSPEAPRPQPAWVRAASEPEELQTEFSFAPAPEAD